MSGSKLVENLAESLVNELSESKTLDLMNDQKFSEFTDLLYEILDRQMKEEDKEKEKEEKEPTESVQELVDKINKYFEQLGGGSETGDLSFKTDRILSIVSKLLMKQNAGDSDKKKDEKKPDSSSEKDKNEVEEANKKKEEEKKEQQKTELDKQTALMIKKLTKDFEESEKKRKKENSIIRKGLRRVERKIGSFIWKALNKFKGLLLIGALIFFRKPIINFFKKIWNDYIKPHVEPLIEKLGEMIGGLWNDFVGWFEGTFLELNDWIKTEFPKVKNWFKENWEKVKDWFVNEFPNAVDTIKKVIDKLMDLPIIRGWIRDYKLNRNEEKQAEIKKELQSTYDPVRRAELEMELKKLRNEHYSTDSEKWYKRNGLGLEGLADVNAVRNIEFPVDFENGQWKYNKLDLSAYDYMKGAKGLEGYNAEIEAAYKKLEPRIKAAQEKYNSAMKGSFNPESYTEAVDSATYPEYNNPLGGMDGQYSATDALAQKPGKATSDSVSQIINYTPFNQVTKNYFQAISRKLQR